MSDFASVKETVEKVEAKAESIVSRVEKMEQQAVESLKGRAFLKDVVADPKTGGLSAARGIAWTATLALVFVALWTAIHMTKDTPNLALAGIVGSLTSVIAAALAWRTKSDNSDKPAATPKDGSDS